MTGLGEAHAQVGPGPGVPGKAPVGTVDAVGAGPVRAPAPESPVDAPGPAAGPESPTSAPGPDVPTRMRWIEEALRTGGNRFEPQVVEKARGALGRAGQRMLLGADLTVVALVGATGSGKSSLFNTLAGMEISEVAARRPTTSEPMACVWGVDIADPLLDWLSIPQHNRTQRESVLDAGRETELAGLVLLDLPDHDSAFVAHRLEVDRLIDLVDLLVWVVDPQKYADESLHSGYLKTLTGRDDVMLVVLNQVDKLDDRAALTCRQDLKRLLDADGLATVRLLTTSAVRGDGMEQLRAEVASVVVGRRGAIERADADLVTAVGELRSGLASDEPDLTVLLAEDDLVNALSEAAGLPVMLDAVEADYRRQALRQLDWPFLRWWRWARPDPLLRVEFGGTEYELRSLTSGTLPAPTPSQKARVDLALRGVADGLGSGLPPRWANAVRAAARSGGQDLSAPLDAAVAAVDLRLSPPSWWRPLELAQLLVAALTVFGFGWLTGIGMVDWVRVTHSSPPFLGPLPLPTVLFAGGLVLGAVLAVTARWMVTTAARQRREVVSGQVHEAVAALATHRVLAPVAAVLDDHRTARQSLIAAG